MSERRRKAKPTQSQSGWQPEPTLSTVEEKDRVRAARNDRLGAYLVDVSKYILTGTFITTLFKDVGDKILIYTLSVILIVVTLWVGIRLTGKSKK